MRSIAMLATAQLRLSHFLSLKIRANGNILQPAQTSRVCVGLFS